VIQYKRGHRSIDRPITNYRNDCPKTGKTGKQTNKKIRTIRKYPPNRRATGQFPQYISFGPSSRLLADNSRLGAEISSTVSSLSRVVSVIIRLYKRQMLGTQFCHGGWNFARSAVDFTGVSYGRCGERWKGPSQAN